MCKSPEDTVHSAPALPMTNTTSHQQTMCAGKPLTAHLYDAPLHLHLLPRGAACGGSASTGGADASAGVARALVVLRAAVPEREPLLGDDERLSSVSDGRVGVGALYGATVGGPPDVSSSAPRENTEQHVALHGMSEVPGKISCRVVSKLNFSVHRCSMDQNLNS